MEDPARSDPERAGNLIRLVTPELAPELSPVLGPEPVDDGYLRHVRDADFVIWLAGPEVTVPVVNEIREALSSRRRLIIILSGHREMSAAPTTTRGRRPSPTAI